MTYYEVRFVAYAYNDGYKDIQHKFDTLDEANNFAGRIKYLSVNPTTGIPTEAKVNASQELASHYIGAGIIVRLVGVFKVMAEKI